MSREWNTKLGRPEKEEVNFTQPSVMHCSNCDAGHCGCYYTNKNECCRCGEVQFKRDPIACSLYSNVMTQRRETEARRQSGNRWVKPVFLD